jgi:hypothetical protein
MSEYWKSTPSYWCKFCSRYVKDTPIEKRNHEASIQHQNNIQRSLRNLHKDHDREEREKQRAKDEVARLKGELPPSRAAASIAAAPTGPSLTPAQQRKAHAEQLAGLGVVLSGQLKEHVTGIGEFQVVNEREVYDGGKLATTTVSRSLAEILAEERSGEGAHEESPGDRLKRKIDDNEDEGDDPRDEEARPKRRAWGSNFKAYPGDDKDAGAEDLDSLLNGVTATKRPALPKKEESDTSVDIKDEESLAVPDDSPFTNEKSTTVLDVKTEPDTAEATQSTIVFKKRKAKK